MQIDEALILKLEKLSRLELESDERKKIKQDLENILRMVNKLQEVNTDGVEPLVYINQEKHVLRPDIVANELTTAQALKNSKNSDGTFFKVPKVK